MIRIINNQFEFQGAVDNFQSFIHERSYMSVGDFELHLYATPEHLQTLTEENIIFITPDKPYIILHREIKSPENTLKIQGQELKQYISRWITKPPADKAYHRINANAETIMKEYVAANCGIPNLIVAPDLKRGPKMVFQTRYKQLNEELEKIGLVSGLGWTVRLDLDNNKYVFDVVEGKDRTIEQDINSRAIFSTDFDNVGSQTYLESKLGYNNVAIVAGQGEGVEREIITLGDATGFDRYETFIDARDIEDPADLQPRGEQKLAENTKIVSFDSEILANANLDYQIDYDVGDTITIQSKDWDISINSLITSMTEIHEVGGLELEATFGHGLPTLGEKLKKRLDTPNY